MERIPESLRVISKELFCRDDVWEANGMERNQSYTQFSHTSSTTLFTCQLFNNYSKHMAAPYVFVSLRPSPFLPARDYGSLLKCQPMFYWTGQHAEDRDCVC